jgi:hypothetical protein
MYAQSATFSFTTYVKGNMSFSDNGYIVPLHRCVFKLQGLYFLRYLNSCHDLSDPIVHICSDCSTSTCYYLFQINLFRKKTI